MSASTLTVAILAGGQSSRMGTDKAAVQLGGKTLGERAAELALALSDDVVVLGHGRGMPEGLARVADAAPDRGPLGGLAGLARRGTRPEVLVIPVDMPRLDAPTLHLLVRALRERGGIEVAHFEGSPLPCAIAGGALARLPDHGALHAAFAGLRRRTIALDDPSALENINTSEDLARTSRGPAFG